MPKFRKKPVVIEAFQLPPEGDSCSDEMCDFLEMCEHPIESQHDGSIEILTLEGVMTAGPGDWIIRGVNGEFYPCKPDIFDKTYERVAPKDEVSLASPRVPLRDGLVSTPDGPTPTPETKPDGQHTNYWILSDEERAKGFVRPVRQSYVHNKCGVVTKMHSSIAETYARAPNFYSHTFCSSCGEHYPVSEFKWDGTSEVVGS